MPGAEERTLKRRIGSVQNTKKITRAMELIAATRVVKAQNRARASKPYAQKITAVIENLSAAGASVKHPLLEQVDDPRHVAVVLITSDRGLCGAYNASVIRAAEREVMAAQTSGADYKLVLVGGKGRDYFSFRNYDIHRSFEGISDSPTYDDAREVAEVVVDLFENTSVDRVNLVYTEFLSVGSQKPTVRRFLPLVRTEDIAESGVAAAVADVEFEPSPEAVLTSLLPRYVEARMFSALLESAASEHASRQRAMKAATDNAEELIIKLTRKMNQVRQDAITTEIMEIIGGAEAMAAAGDGAAESDPSIDHALQSAEA
jgi:F-type H+-transporting ATPase subunit gamma